MDSNDTLLDGNELQEAEHHKNSLLALAQDTNFVSKYTLTSGDFADTEDPYDDTRFQLPQTPTSESTNTAASYPPRTYATSSSDHSDDLRHRYINEAAAALHKAGIPIDSINQFLYTHDKSKAEFWEGVVQCANLFLTKSSSQALDAIPLLHSKIDSIQKQMANLCELLTTNDKLTVQNHNKESIQGQQQSSIQPEPKPQSVTPLEVKFNDATPLYAREAVINLPIASACKQYLADCMAREFIPWSFLHAIHNATSPNTKRTSYLEMIEYMRSHGMPPDVYDFFIKPWN
ncbi:hypothetical protein 2 [Shayang ascaridia galli virus 2]|uniref:Uncharacterized protein n=1 Tax=Shayang ascaridia galli virus 2 TaxID=1923460 RepID=A0A1L3KMR6_9RHAB|nr:hypothetical protein 2 [Shayang ascaridia galli virus 2]APG78674.1 hypothetical protein 2 [Shayang ascaridia galli virus 2]